MADGEPRRGPARPRRRRPLPRADRARRPRLRRGEAAARLLRAPRRRPAGRRSQRSARPPARPACWSSPTASAATSRSPPPPTRRRWSARRRRPGARSPGLGADAFTANPLLGRDALEPLVAAAEAAGAGVFALVRTSNPGAADVLDLPAPRRAAARAPRRRWSTGSPTACSATAGLSGIGAVVGATEPEHIARLRELMPRSIFLIPGVGAQGGEPELLGAAFAPGPAAALVAASRGIAGDPDPGRRGRAAAGRRLGDLDRLTTPLAATTDHPLPTRCSEPSPMKKTQQLHSQNPRRPRPGGGGRRDRRPGRRQRRSRTTRATKAAASSTSQQQNRQTEAAADEGEDLRSQSGDTLIRIAHKTGVPVAELQALNPEIDPQILIAGEMLKLR